MALLFLFTPRINKELIIIIIRLLIILLSYVSRLLDELGVPGNTSDTYKLPTKGGSRNLTKFLLATRKATSTNSTMSDFFLRLAIYSHLRFVAYLNSSKM